MNILPELINRKSENIVPGIKKNPLMQQREKKQSKTKQRQTKQNKLKKTNILETDCLFDQFRLTGRVVARSFK